MTLYDKHGIPIMVGDVLKVFHFIGARRKRHYMYKMCIDSGMWGQKEHSPEYHWLRFSHLDMSSDSYYEERNDRILTDYEIVQSVDCEFEKRNRKR
jgi:hypothetical protein